MIGREGDYVVDPDSGCWIWLRSRSGGGYGNVNRPRADGSRSTTTAHRWYYEEVHGMQPKHLNIDHLCRNRLCVNPDHLEAVTQVENVHRGAASQLTHLNVHRIKFLWEQGFLVSEIAQVFDIHRSTVSNILSGYRWSDTRPVCHQCRAENAA